MPENNNLNQVLAREGPDGLALIEKTGGNSSDPPDYIFREINPALERLTGFSREHLIGQKASRIELPLCGEKLTWDFFLKELENNGENASPVEFFTSSNQWLQMDVLAVKKDFMTVILRDITEFKEKELALEKKAKKYQSLVENSNDALYIHDFDGNILEVNENACRHLKYSREEMLEKNLRDINSEEENQKMPRRLKTLQKEGRIQFTGDFCCKDGSLISGEVSSRVVSYNDRGTIQSLARDITQRRENERAIMEKSHIIQRLNEAIVAQAGAGDYEDLIDLILTQLQGHTGAVLAAFSEYSPEKKALISRNIKTDHKLLEMVKKIGGPKILNVETPVGPDLYKEIVSSVVGCRPTLTAATQGAIPESISTAIQKITGIRQMVGLAHLENEELYGVSILGLKEQNPELSTEFLESYAHISAISLRRKKAEARLRDNEKKYRSLIENLNEVVYRVDLEGRIEYLSPNIEAITGYSFQELKGRKFIDLIPPGDGTRRKRVCSRVLEGTNEPVQFPFLKKDGSLHWVKTRAQKREEEGRVVGAQGVLTDITNIKKRDKKIQEQKSKVEALNLFARSLMHLQTEQEIYEATVEAARSILNFSYAFVGIKEGDRIVYRATSLQEDIKSYPLNRGIIGKTLRTGKSFVADDIQNHPEASPRKKSYRSGLSVPLGNIGVFQACSDQLAAFDDEDLHMVELMIGHSLEALQRVQSQQELQASEERNRALVEALPDLMFLFDKEGRTIDYKAGQEGRLLVPPSSFLHQPLHKALPPELAELTGEKLEQAFQTGELQTYEYQLNIKGEIREFESRMLPCGEDKALAIVRDITDNKKREKELAESEARARKQRQALGQLVLEDEIVRGDVEGALQKITRILTDTLAVERAGIWVPGEKSGQLRCLALYEASSGQFYRGETRPAESVPGYLEAILKDSSVLSGDQKDDGGQDLLKEIYLKPLGLTAMMDGEVIEDKLTGIICLENKGEPRRWHPDEEAFVSTIASLIAQVFLNDDRKKAYEALRASEERLKSIITVSNTGAWEYHYDLDYLWCSPEYFSMLGHDPEDFPMERCSNLQKTWLDFIHPDDRKRAAEKFASYLENPEGMYENYFRLKHKKGNWVWVWSRGQTLRDQEGNPTNLTVGTHIDITESKEAEEKLRYMSFHDSLTDTYNRAFLEEEMRRLDTERQLPISIIMADVNGLKLVNDTYGHSQGDEMLKLTTRTLKKCCREEDIIARWGGDEFVILLPLTSLEKTQKICKRIISVCSREYVGDIPLSISLGVGSKERKSKDLYEVLKEAEDSMYKHKLTISRSARNAALDALLKTLAAKSFETEIHTRRMQEIAHKIGLKLGLAESELSRLSLLITLHDIGKINISEEILTKEGPLNSAEWEIMKRHPASGYRIAQAMPEFAHVAQDILAHHEKWDGSGYPRGLEGRDIPLLARITAIADAYEVMSNGRPYKEPLSRGEIINEFKNCSGGQFDPKLVEIFLGVMEEDRERTGSPDPGKK